MSRRSLTHQYRKAVRGIRGKVESVLREEIRSIFRPVAEDFARQVAAQPPAVTERFVTERIGNINVQMPQLGVVIEKRPTKPQFQETTLSDVNKWYMLVSFAKNQPVATWSIHNRGAQDVYYAYANNSSYYNLLSADVKDGLDTRPPEVWAKKSSSVSSPVIMIEWWEYE